MPTRPPQRYVSAPAAAVALLVIWAAMAWAQGAPSVAIQGLPPNCDVTALGVPLTDVPVSVAFSSVAGAKRIEIYVDGRLQYTEELPSPVLAETRRYLWDATRHGPGTYTISVQVIDTAGRTGRADAVVVYPGSAAPVASATQPTVTVLFPPEGATLSGRVSCEAQVTGVEPRWVMFWLDGRLVEAKTSPPYIVTLDTVAHADGPHTLQAVARTGVSQIESRPQRVFFLNGPARTAPAANVPPSERAEAVPAGPDASGATPGRVPPARADIGPAIALPTGELPPRTPEPEPGAYGLLAGPLTELVPRGQSRLSQPRETAASWRPLEAEGLAGAALGESGPAPAVTPVEPSPPGPPTTAEEPAVLPDETAEHEPMDLPEAVPVVAEEDIPPAERLPQDEGPPAPVEGLAGPSEAMLAPWTVGEVPAAEVLEPGPEPVNAEPATEESSEAAVEPEPRDAPSGASAVPEPALAGPVLLGLSAPSEPPLPPARPHEEASVPSPGSAAQTEEPLPAEPSEAVPTSQPVGEPDLEPAVSGEPSEPPVPREPAEPAPAPDFTAVGLAGPAEGSTALREAASRPARQPATRQSGPREAGRATPSGPPLESAEFALAGPAEAAERPRHTPERPWREPAPPSEVQAQPTARADMTIAFDGRPLELATQPVIDEGVVFAPAQAIVEAAGGTLAWNEDTGEARMELSGVVITVRRGQSTAVVGDVAATMPAEARVIGGAICVPLEFLARALGLEVRVGTETGTYELAPAAPPS